MTDDDVVAEPDRIEAIVELAQVLTIADLLPVHHHRDGGRPRHHTAFACVLFHVLAKRVFGGRVRRTATELGHPRTWRRLSDLVKRAYPHRPDIWLPEKPIRRHHYLAFRDKYLTEADGLAGLADGVSASGVAVAHAMGLCSDNSSGSLTHPAGTQCLAADGKVIAGPTRYGPGVPVPDPETGEVVRYRRCDPDVEEHSIGGRSGRVRGHKFEILSTRGPEYYQRAILGVAPVHPGGEIDALSPLIANIYDALEIVALVYDGALRGKHVAAFVREYGLICIAPVIAKRVNPDDHTDRLEHEVMVGPVDVHYPGGRRSQMELWARGGAACEVSWNEVGERVFTPLICRQLQVRGKQGARRLYGEYETSDGGTLRIPLYQTKDDLQRKFNRCEHLRPIPPGSDDYKRLYGRRSDAESLNRQIEDCLWQKRANSYGAARVFCDLLGWALGENAIALYVQRRRSGVSPPGEAIAA